MIDVESLASRLKSALKTMMDRNGSTIDYSLIIERDYERDCQSSKLDEMDENMNCYNDENETLEIQACMTVKAEIEAAIMESSEKEHHCRLILPPDLLTRVSQDIVRMSAAEPCGIRGCVIYVHLKEKGQSRRLTTIFGNPLSPPTFEIHLTLAEDNRGWKAFQKFYLTIKGCILNSHWTAMPKIVCAAYQLEKRRLYRRTPSAEVIA